MAIFTSSQLKAIRDFQDNALNTLGKLHKVIFSPKNIPCSYCLKPAISLHAGNVGLHGGPMPNLCGYCGGSGYIQQEVSETVLLEVDFSPRQTPKVVQVDAPGVKLPWDVILVKGYLRDLPKLQQSIEIQVNLPSAPITTGRYTLSGDGLDAFNIIQGRYFLAVLVRNS